MNWRILWIPLAILWIAHCIRAQIGIAPSPFVRYECWRAGRVYKRWEREYYRDHPELN